MEQIEQTVDQAKFKLQQWQLKYADLLWQVQQTENSGQSIFLPVEFRKSRQLLLYKMKKLRCEVCHYGDEFKYVRIAQMDHPEIQKKCMVFILCIKCYQKSDYDLPIRINRECYTPMNVFLARVHETMEKLAVDKADFDKNYQKYNIFQKRLAYTINQIDKAIEKHKMSVCTNLKRQISILKNICVDNGFGDLEKILCQRNKCNCKNQCCYCDYKFINDEYLKRNCPYYHSKDEQNQLIKKINLLSSFDKEFTEQDQDKIFNSFIQKLQIILIKNVGALQHTMKIISNQSQRFSLSNIQLRRQILENLNLVLQQPNKSKSIEVIQKMKQKMLQQRVINQMTHDHISKFPNQITQICLNYMESQSVLRSNMERFSQLTSIEIGCNEIGSLVVSDTIKCVTQSSNCNQHQNQQSKQHHFRVFNSEGSEINRIIGPKDRDLKYINLTKYQHLKSISFNCKVPLRQQFYSSFQQSHQLEYLYFNWNHYQLMEKFNLSTHFSQGKSLTTTSPKVTEIKQLYMKDNLRNIWIGNCGRVKNGIEQVGQEVKHYVQILNKKSGLIEGVMIGQFDGRLRQVDRKIYEALTAGMSLRALFLSKIQIKQELFIQLLSKNQLLETLYLSQCEQISQQVMNQIVKIPLLKKLAIIQINKFNLEGQILYLETFILQRCYSIIKRELVNFLSKSRLKYLSLEQCPFVGDDIIRSVLSDQISNGSVLQSLILGNTKLTNSTLLIINNFKYLSNLDISSTQISLLKFMQDLVQNKFTNLLALQRLNMKKMKEIQIKIARHQLANEVSEYYNDLFGRILEHFPVLSHLDISYNPVISQRAIRFGLSHLCYLVVTQTKYSHKENVEHSPKDHPGMNCPFINGRLSLGDNIMPNIDGKWIVQPQSKEQVIKTLPKRKNFLKIIKQ